MTKLLAVFIGGGLGSVLRYALSLAIPTNKAHDFPWPTFTANVLASALLGVLLAWTLRSPLDQRIRLFLMVGLCGGFSTFSTFSKEVFLLIERGTYFAALSYALASVVVCVLAIAIAYTITNP